MKLDCKMTTALTASIKEMKVIVNVDIKISQKSWRLGDPKILSMQILCPIQKNRRIEIDEVYCTEYKNGDYNK